MPIRVATLNTWFLPGPLARHKRERMSAIGAALPELDADLIAFQEVWTRASRAGLIAGAERSGYTHVWHNPKTAAGSGLLVVSRLPLHDIHFEPFVARGFAERIRHMDYYSGKGFARITVETREGPLILLDTHLHANYATRGKHDEYVGIRAAQIIQFCAAIAEITDPVIAVGDFNFEEDDDAYRVLSGLTGLTDIAALLDRRQITSLADNPYHRSNHTDRRIDYVLCRNGTRFGLRPVSIRRVYDKRLDFDGEPGAYSDHAGLLAEIEIDGVAEVRNTVDAGALMIGAKLLEAGRVVSNRRQRRQRTAATGALATGLGALAGVPRAGRSRRRFLANGLRLASGLGFAIFLEQAGLSEVMIRREHASYDFAERQLAELRTNG